MASCTDFGMVNFSFSAFAALLSVFIIGILPFSAKNKKVTVLSQLLAVGVAVGLYFGLRPLIGSEEVGWMCILGAAPFAACGFFKYHGMTAEQAAWAWFKSEFLYPKKLVFKSDSLYFDAMKDAIVEGEKPPRKRKNRKSQPPAGKEQ